MAVLHEMDEGPAAVRGMSLQRLGICQPSDWSGSAVDFVDHGFRRFCSRIAPLMRRESGSVTCELRTAFSS